MWSTLKSVNACFVNRLKTNKEFRVKTLTIETQVSSNYGSVTYQGSEGRKRNLYTHKYWIWFWKKNFLFLVY